MLYVFAGCFAFGIIYSLMSIILGNHGADHGGMDHAGFHGDASGHDADVPSPFNPLVIASAITTFGAAGLIAKLGFGISDIASSALSLTFAGIIGAVIFFGVVKLMYGSQSNSTFSQRDLVGKEAEVITPIPCKGLGEIAYVINGIRCNMPAKSAYSSEIPRGESVVIKDVTGNIAVVTKRMTIEDYETLQMDFGREKHKREKIEE